MKFKNNYRMCILCKNIYCDCCIPSKSITTCCNYGIVRIDIRTDRIISLI